MIGETFQFYVVGFSHQEFLEEFDAFGEGGPLFRVFVPTVVHYVVEFAATMLRFCQSVTFFHLKFKLSNMVFVVLFLGIHQVKDSLTVFFN